MPNETGKITKQYIAFVLQQQKDPDTFDAIFEPLCRKIKEEKLPYRFRKDEQTLQWECVEVSDDTDLWLKRFITEHEQMLELKKDVRKLANHNPDIDKQGLMSVLITGETGTGKEIIARAIHGDSLGKFVAVNCAGIPHELFESHFFGHKKGSFTGAIRDNAGYMRAAKDGTLFLDEVSELPMDAQAKLLRALQERQVMAVGEDTIPYEINCRVVCATNRKLTEIPFREDLLARLSVFELHTLPLSSRRDDIKLILESLEGGKEFIEAYHALQNKQIGGTLDVKYNVRSLQSHVQRYKVLGRLPE